MTGTRIAVVGAGVGGLVTGVALAAAGVRCTLFEQSRALDGGGYGIQISPNGARLLDRLGVTGRLAGVLVEPEAIELRRWRDGGVIGSVELGVAARLRYGAPYLTMRRADLTWALHDRLVELCGEPVRFGHRCVHLGDSTGSAELRFADGTAHRADLVVGADGINSVVRRLFTTSPLRLSSHAVHRGQVTADRMPWSPMPPRVVVWLGPGQHCVCYPIAGGRSVNVVATTPAGGWFGRKHPATDLSAAYAGWHRDVRALLAAAGPMRPGPLHVARRLDRWHVGRFAVIGDAAHPMLPFRAQGATQAAEDAVTLAAELRGTAPSGVAAALARYEAARRWRVARIAAAVRAGTVEHHLPDGVRQRRRDRRLATPDPSAYDWLYGHDAGRHLIGQPTNGADRADTPDRRVPDADRVRAA